MMTRYLHQNCLLYIAVAVSQQPNLKRKLDADSIGKAPSLYCMFPYPNDSLYLFHLYNYVAAPPRPAVKKPADVPEWSRGKKKLENRAETGTTEATSLYCMLNAWQA